jgi:hypothetical protein
MAVFHGVVVDVVHVSGQVGRIADRVFPEAPLPDAALAGALASFGQPFPSRDAAREGGFDQSPAGSDSLRLDHETRQSPMHTVHGEPISHAKKHCDRR